MQERLNMLLKKYGVTTAATLVGDRSAAIDGKQISLLPWRYERRFEELKKLVDSKTVDGISVFRIISIGRKTDSIEELLTRELDVCRYVLSTEIKEVFPSPTKTNAIRITPEQLREIASSVRIPIAAIGGITAENVSEIKGCGYRGIAAVSAVFAAEDVKAAAELLRRKAEEGIGL